MTHRYLEFATATAVACVAATVLATAQTASPTQTPSARAEDGRAVTAIGCLKQERDVPGRTAAAGIQGEDSRPGDGFVLMNARITNASIPEAPITSDPSPGSASAAAAERERRTEPSGAPGAGGAGTSGTGSTSVQTTERPPNESARGAAGTAANRASVRGPDTMYKVVGLPAAQLTPLVNKEVEVKGTLDANTMGSAALRQPGATLGREPANTPSASTPPPSPTQAPATQSDRQDTTAPAASGLPELKATSIRATGGRCQGT